MAINGNCVNDVLKGAFGQDSHDHDIPSHYHSLTVDGDTGYTGGGAAFDNQPAYYELILIRRCYAPTWEPDEAISWLGVPLAWLVARSGRLLMMSGFARCVGRFTTNWSRLMAYLFKRHATLLEKTKRNKTLTGPLVCCGTMALSLAVLPGTRIVAAG